MVGIVVVCYGVGDDECESDRYNCLWIVNLISCILSIFVLGIWF